MTGKRPQHQIPSELVKLLDSDLPPYSPVRDEAREEVARIPARFYRGSVRVANQQFWTDEEYDRFRTETLRQPLP